MEKWQKIGNLRAPSPKRDMLAQETVRARESDGLAALELPVQGDAWVAAETSRAEHTPHRGNEIEPLRPLDQGP